METLAKSLIPCLKSWKWHIQFHFEIPSRSGCRVGIPEGCLPVFLVNCWDPVQWVWLREIHNFYFRSSQVYMHTHTYTMHIVSYTWIVKDLLFKHKSCKVSNCWGKSHNIINYLWFSRKLESRIWWSSSMYLCSYPKSQRSAQERFMELYTVSLHCKSGALQTLRESLFLQFSPLTPCLVESDVFCIFRVWLKTGVVKSFFLCSYIFLVRFLYAFDTDVLYYCVTTLNIILPLRTVSVTL